VSTRCVFALCTAVLTMLAELKAPGSDEGLRRVPQHRLGGHEEFGQCPASLMALPLSEYDTEQLAVQLQAIQRMITDRTTAAVDRPEPPVQKDWRSRVLPVETYRSQMKARPDPVPPSGFRPNGGGGRGIGHTGYDRMPVVLTPRQPSGWLGPSGSSGETTVGGSAGVTSVEDVKRVIARADELLAEASDMAFIVEGKISEGAELLNIVRDTARSDIGAPQALAAIEKIGEVRDLLRQAIEESATYRGTL
jgi:hypothetical protein